MAKDKLLVKYALSCGQYILLWAVGQTVSAAKVKYVSRTAKKGLILSQQAPLGVIV